MRPGVAKRKSDAMARIAPAPAHTPSTAAAIGCGHARIAFTRSPVMRVKASRPSIAICVSGPMISCTSPPEQKLPPAPVNTIARTSGASRETAEEIPELRVGIEGERILPLGPIERDHAYATVETPAEVPRLQILVVHATAPLPSDPSVAAILRESSRLEHAEQLHKLIALPPRETVHQAR